MTENALELTGRLARAARALVGVSAAHAAEAAGLEREELRAFEKDRGGLSPDRTRALRLALEELGAFFIADGANRRGHGVRLKFSAEKARRVETWEDEGGLPAEDDV